MAMPRKIKNFNVFVDGEGYAGRCTEAQLPKLARKMEEFRAGGMDGPVDIDMGADKMEGELTVAEMSRALLLRFGAGAIDGVAIRLRGAAIADGAADATDAIEVVMRGRFKEIDMGSFKSGDNHEMKLSVTLSYFKYQVNGETLIEIDHANMVYLVGGVDLLAAQRTALDIA